MTDDDEDEEEENYEYEYDDQDVDAVRIGRKKRVPTRTITTTMTDRQYAVTHWGLSLRINATHLLLQDVALLYYEAHFELNQDLIKLCYLLANWQVSQHLHLQCCSDLKFREYIFV